MSEKTVIGGTVYETVGSSSSNLLLRCNGTARIQWGSKLIDLIKNGKIVSGNSELNIRKILDKSEIKSDGIYILEENDKYQLWLSKDDKLYNLTDSDLYISASAKLDITVELRKQALENIGLYFNTLKEVEESKIQEGLVYVLETKTLYTILGGVISEFEAKLKTITVEKEQQEGEIINNSIKIALAISDDEYITLQDNAVVINKDLKINQQHCVCSEGASDYLGYRLYVSEGLSYLDVDVINVRQTLSNKDYEEVTFNELRIKITSRTLLPGMWYAIMDFQNHWQFANLDSANRPILVQAYTSDSLYKEGKLLNNRSISLLYDYTILDEIIFKNDDGADITEMVKGKITWMRDENGNEADFDFLDYDLSFLGMQTTVVHPYKLDSSVKSIFPTGSYNNKITTYNLFGTMYNSEGIILYPLNDEGVPQLTLNFKYNDSIPEDGTEPVLMSFHDNVITCKGITISDKCTEFCNNTFKVVENTTIVGKMTDSVFGNVVDCYFNGDVDNVTFKDMTNCWFMGDSLLNNVVCRSNINAPVYLLITSATYPTLYDSDKYKNVYYTISWGLTIEDVTESGGFFRGLIIMFYPGIGGSIPEGWAICDGSEVTWEGRTVTVPNLTGRFIKAVSDESEIGSKDVYEDNTLILEEKHLPHHEHPHSHLVNVSGSYSDEYPDYKPNQMSVGEDKDAGSVVIKTKTKNITLTGTTTSLNSESTTKEQESIKLEPNYYALIFIIKL